MPCSLTELLRQMRLVTTTVGLDHCVEIFNQFDKLTANSVQLHYDIAERVKKPPRVEPNKYAALSGCKKARLMITHKKDYEGTRTCLQREAIGAIVLFPEWKLLSLMPQIPQTQAPEKELKENLSAYDVYPLLDGTMVTYYHYEGKWCPSTMNAINSSDHSWIGSSDYDHALKELFSAHKDFNFGRMSKDRCYTFVFKHPDFHPFLAESPRITLIQSRSITNINDVNRADDIGVPLCAKVSITHAEMMSKKANALKLYTSTRNDICYGYILRARAATSDSTDYIVESTLMTYIRKVVYDLPPASSAPQTLSCPVHRVYYYILRALMVHDFRMHFLNIFPQYEDLWKWCDKLLVNLADKVIVMHAGQTRDSAAPSIEEATARMLTEKLRAENININSSHARSIITDFVRDPRSLNTIHACIVTVYEEQTAKKNKSAQ